MSIQCDHVTRDMSQVTQSQVYTAQECVCQLKFFFQSRQCVCWRWTGVNEYAV